jgi:hypothetical protein
VDRVIYRNAVASGLAPEEQHVYSPRLLIDPAPIGAECNLDAQGT